MKGTYLLPLALCLAACSPYEYSKEVAGFSTGIDQLKTAVTSGHKNLQADKIALLQLQQLDALAPLVLSPSCAVAVDNSRAGTNEPCLLLTAAQSRAERDKPFWIDEVQQTETAALGAVNVLAGYAKALAAVTNAADRAAYDAATRRLAASVQNLAGEAKAVAPGADLIAPAAVNLIAWVVGAALDEDRFDTLRQSVKSAQVPVDRVAKAVQQGLTMVTNERVTVLSRYTRALAEALSPSLSLPASKERFGSYKDRFALADAARVKLDAVRHSNSDGVISDLLAAHETLAKAVDDPKTNLGHLMAAVSEFEAKTAALRDAMAAATN